VYDVPFSLHPCQHLLLVVFLMIAILTGVRWNLSVVLICISFMARDGEHFFLKVAAEEVGERREQKPFISLH
jgi:hypothetical protein